MSNETKQTAVDWLLDRIEDVDLTEKLWENVKQQAKEMEKEQSVKFALHYAFGEQEVSEDLKINIEKLYNETYGGNK
jgi:hypothetical protein